MTVTAAGLMLLLFGLSLRRDEREAQPPAQIVVNPVQTRLALIAVDGLSDALFESRKELLAGFPWHSSIQPIAAPSAAERWTSIATGVPTTLHGVRAIEGVRLLGGSHLIQSVSSHDSLLLQIAPATGLAHRQPLPPAVRDRDFVWGSFAQRGVPVISVNWWSSDDRRSGALDEVSQQTIFARAGQERDRSTLAVASHIDDLALRVFLQSLQERNARFATVYLPALDVVLNRVAVSEPQRIAGSVAALDRLVATTTALRRLGYAVLVVGMPGDQPSGKGVLASSIPLVSKARSAFDIAPTLCALEGFPLSVEMPGTALADVAVSRIRSYGQRREEGTSSLRKDEEYYQSLRSLGYIR